MPSRLLGRFGIDGRFEIGRSDGRLGIGRSDGRLGIGRSDGRSGIDGLSGIDGWSGIDAVDGAGIPPTPELCGGWLFPTVSVRLSCLPVVACEEWFAGL